MTRAFSTKRPPPPRAADHRQRLRRIEPPVIERPSGDRAGELAAIGLQQPLHVGERREAAGGDDGNRQGVGERQGRLDVEAGQNAVARDVGVDDGAHARVFEALAEIERRHARGARPAVDGDKTILGVDPYGDAARVKARRLAHERRVFDGRRADDDARDAFFQPARQRAHVANAAAELHGNRQCGENGFDRLGVARRAREGAVEIDDMQIFETDSLESARLLGGIVIEHGRAVHIALREAHALTFLQIDCGKQNHGRHLRKLPINARPSLWLFSG